MAAPAESIAIAGLLPHPPIAVPDVAGDRAAECRATTAACADFAERVVAAAPERLFLVSPHSPRARRAFGLWSGARLRGDLGFFRAPGAEVDLPNDTELVRRLRVEAHAEGLDTWDLPGSEPLDHGAVVPLVFLVRAGWAGPTAVAALPMISDSARELAFGRALTRALSALPGRTALVASGDMSHRVLPGAPAGFHPRAADFDRAVCDRVAAGDLQGLFEIDPGLRGIAGEDVVDSSAVVIGALGDEPRGVELLSYEHPFGVGYLVALFHVNPV
jgi:aromatic ring-opening dioxygenase LigB subunit